MTTATTTLTLTAEHIGNTFGRKRIVDRVAPVLFRDDPV